MNCQYCNRESKTLVSKVQHELYCQQNPNKRYKVPSYGMLGKARKPGSINQWSNPEYKISNETRKKLSESSKKQTWTEERRQAHSKRMKEAVNTHLESYTSANRGRTKQIIFDGVKFQGSWELEFYKWAKAEGLNPVRVTEGFKYIWNGERTYFPDFYLEPKDLYVEVKGYKTERDEAKWTQFPKRLLIVDKFAIDQIKKNKYSLD